jgi:hypothetical protein
MHRHHVSLFSPPKPHAPPLPDPFRPPSLPPPPPIPIPPPPYYECDFYDCVDETKKEKEKRLKSSVHQSGGG